VRDALAQGDEGGVLVRVRGVGCYRGPRRRDDQGGAPVRVQGVARRTAVLASSAEAAHGASRVELEETHRTVR
jgi:hypothetical protein